MAQLVEHFIRNERVRGSSPRVGSTIDICLLWKITKMRYDGAWECLF